MLQFHGGGWRGGSRAGVHSRCWELAGHGFTTVAVEYRRLPEAPWPAALADVHAAMRWAAGHAAELGADPARLVLQGYSAGAHLALLAVTAAQREGQPPVAAVVAAYPPTDFHPTGPEEVGRRPAEAGETLPGWLLFDRATTEDEVRAVSPPPAGRSRASRPRCSCTAPATRSGRTRRRSASTSGCWTSACRPTCTCTPARTTSSTSCPRYRADVSRDVAFFLRRMVTDRAAIETDVAENSMFARLRRAREAEHASAERRTSNMKASIICPNTYTEPGAWGRPFPVPRAAFAAESGQNMLAAPWSRPAPRTRRASTSCPCPSITSPR